MNRVCITGRLTKDPSIKYSNEMCVARFTLAVDRRGKKQDGKPTADFPSCVAFGKTGEIIEKYFRKGMKADIVGRLQTGSYDDKNGNKVYTTDVIVDDLEFGESKAAQQEKPKEEPTDQFMNVPDDDSDLPFN